MTSKTDMTGCPELTQLQGSIVLEVCLYVDQCMVLCLTLVRF